MSGQNIGDLSGEILVNRYKCDRRLGKQAGRQTLLARDLETQQQVVVKLLSFSSDFNRVGIVNLDLNDGGSKSILKIQLADRAAHLNPHLINWLEWMTEPSLNKRLSSAVEAGRVFKNPRQIDKTPMPLQPPGSYIKLTKNSDFIEIIIPPQGLTFGLVALLSAAIAANSPSFVNVFGESDDNGNKITNLEPINHELIILAGFFLAAVGVMFLFALFRELHLRIDRQQISCTSHLLGLTWNNSKAASRQEICQLEIEQGEYIASFTRHKLSKTSQIIIQANNQEYRLGANPGLSEVEIEWLATELSQWLGVKIKRTLTDKVDEWLC